MSNVYKNIAEKIRNMSKSQEKIAKYVLANQNQAPFLTVEKLAKLSGVSIATVTRFVTFLGYKGYPEFVKDTQESMQEKVNSNKILSDNNSNYGVEKRVSDIFNSDIENIKLTMKRVNIFELKRAVNLLLKSKRIYIVSRGNVLPLGMLLKYYFSLMFDNVNLIENIEELPKGVNECTEDDVIIGISFEKYTRSTVEIFNYLKEKGASSIAITDKLLSPLVPYADITLMSENKCSSFMNSFVGPLSLINTLIILIEKEKKDYISNNVQLLDETWRKFDLFI